MDNYRDRINTIFAKSSLIQEDFALWKSVIAEIPDNLLEGIYNFLDKKPESLGFLTSNLRKKVAAIEGGDQKLWAEALEEDSVFIRSEVPKNS